ncbi:hypothetical protein [Hymenobacter saemangeumensis]
MPDSQRRTEVLHKLMAAYQAPERHYHTLAHIGALLNRAEQVQLLDPDVVKLAIWFHDAVYNALKSDNEARSAAWALDFLTYSTLEPSRCRRVAYLIERTHDHTQAQPPDDADLLFFLDADLSILGAPEPDYWEYARQVRREYRVVPDVLYRPGRCKVLEKMLATPKLFRTAEMHEKLEASARRNLQAELQAWKGTGLPQG